MAAIGRLFDSAAIGLSSLCIVHCLLFPLAVAMLPFLGQALPAGEAVHVWLLLAAPAISAPALWIGYRVHRQLVPSALALGGASFLAAGLFLSDRALGETIATVVGAALLAIAHLRNASLRHRAGELLR